MKCMRRLEFMRWVVNRVINKFAQRVRISALYSTRTGIKSINQLMQSRVLMEKNPFFLDASDLYLGFDALKDEYTLVGTGIVESPHYGLMEALASQSSIANTEYVLRYSKGSLDQRSAVYLTKKAKNVIVATFKARYFEVQNGDYPAVQVYCVNGKYYVADGKHRAALCAYLNKPIKCVDIGRDFLSDSFRLWIYSAMKKNPDEFVSNLELFE